MGNKIDQPSKTTPRKLWSIKPGKFVHMDLCSPFATFFFGNASYFMLVKDDSSGYMLIYFLAYKYEVVTRFQFVEKEILQDIGCIQEHP